MAVIGPSEASEHARVRRDRRRAVSDAWQKGAAQWDASRRLTFANDPLNLLAVDGPTNLRKSDGDAATWLPPQRSYRCRFVARQVAVKAKWKLAVTAAERDAIARVLSNVPSSASRADQLTAPLQPSGSSGPKRKRSSSSLA